MTWRQLSEPDKIHYSYYIIKAFSSTFSPVKQNPVALDDILSKCCTLCVWGRFLSSTCYTLVVSRRQQRKRFSIIPVGRKLIAPGLGAGSVLMRQSETGQEKKTKTQLVALIDLTKQLNLGFVRRKIPNQSRQRHTTKGEQANRYRFQDGRGKTLQEPMGKCLQVVRVHQVNNQTEPNDEHNLVYFDWVGKYRSASPKVFTKLIHPTLSSSRNTDGDY